MEKQYGKIFAPPTSDFVLFERRKSDFGARPERVALTAGKVYEHFQATQIVIERIRRNCAATEAACRRQIEFINQQREDLNLTK
jgi:hypothetical protein